MDGLPRIIVFAPVFALMVFWLISLVPELKLSSRRFGLSIAVMVRQSDGGYRRKRYPADGTVVYEDADTDAARVEVVNQYVVLRETHEFPIVGEWTRDRREFSKREIRIHVPAGSIVQGEYDFE